MKKRLTPRLLLSAMLALVCLLTLGSRPIGAQTAFGSMVGNVTDASGGFVSGATVKITLIATNDTRSVVTDAAGAYTISTVTPGTYRVEISRQGFRIFVASDILVNMNNAIRVDAQLEVGALSERVEVTTTTTAQLQTERADVHAEIASDSLLEMPQPNRTYEGLLELVPGTAPPAGQLAGGTNNPSKSMTFAFNGTGTAGGTVRIEGINAINLWNTSAQSYVPSIEAIQNVNVATNANDAEQGLAGGASVNVMLKSGSNQTHGGVYEYNTDSAFEANNFFSNASGISKPPLLVDNNAGGFVGGHIIKNKLFYFGSYEGDFNHSANSGVLSLPNAAQLSGNMSLSGTPIYDPNSGNPDGTGKTPFPGNIIPASRFDPVVLKIIPNIPATNVGGAAVVNNFYINDANVYNLHKIDTKLDYNVTSKLRVSGRFGYQPYYDFQQPIYGPILGGTSAFATAGAGNYLQHGAGLAVSGSGSYVISPTFVIDASYGKTSSHQILMPNLSNERYGLDVLGIPGTNNGPLPWTGGVPNFAISNFVTMGASYPALEYFQPLYEYVANATKIKGSHTIRFGADLNFQHMRHIEDRNNTFSFTGAATTVNGGPGANPYNSLSDFLLGDFYEGTNWLQVLQPYLTMRTWEAAIYVRDQWHVNSKLTVNYGVRWEYYPVPTRDSVMNQPSSVAPTGLGTTGNGLYFLNMQNATVSVCGAGSIPTNCGISVSKRLLAPSIGIAYRPTDKFVIRMGYAVAPSQSNMGQPQIQAYPGEVQLDEIAQNPYSYVGQLHTGLPTILAAPNNNSVFPILPNTGNVTSVNSKKNYLRGYYQSYNFTVQRELPGDLLASLGYVGTHAVKLQTAVDVNYGQLGGGTASQPLAFVPDYSTGITTPLPWGADKYNSLQATLNKRTSRGLTFQAAYTYSKDIGMSTSILIPQYISRDYYPTSLDRTHHLIITASYELPFGRTKPMMTSGVGAAILGGWSVNGIFNHYSGTLFTVSSSAASCNCPGNSQTANLILPGASIIGSGVGGQPYFNPLAYAPVAGAVFGTSGFDQLRGPGNTNLDMSIFRIFRIKERFRFQIRGEAMNVSNTPHFNNPASNVSNLQLNPDGSVKNLNGFSQITSTNPLGRLIDPRYLRLGARLTF
jgi:carboxypeptidase family protein/TonB-dependent receptor-like protein